ncbi:uncharacterized protein LOC119770087 [Culex quinquefasciatus]|uniref:uncharacterized protein LOC119770087 n=1 Tax=Culex quinquefasciatus TaxID=7176 RepID=UPI0018E2E981|nr:uncharacterized protein LOC119770087 [Culex quinquefasciatus]
MSLSCEINFPYNWAEEFYYGERLHLSVALKCHKQLTVKGVTLNVSYRSERESQSNDYSRYIDDQEEESHTKNNCWEKSSIKHHSEIDLFGARESFINMLPGTYIFDLECFLPEITSEQRRSEESVTSFKFALVVQKIPKADLINQIPVSALRLIQLEPIKRKTFVWPGNFDKISDFSVASAIIGYYYVKNLEEPDNRRNYSEESENEDSLESWLDCILEKPERVEDDEDEEEGFPEEEETSKGGNVEEYD